MQNTAYLLICLWSPGELKSEHTEIMSVGLFSVHPDSGFW